MPDTMIERVARAIYETVPQRMIGVATPQPIVPFEQADDATIERCIAQARAVLAAMREPTEAMVKAGALNQSPPGYRMNAQFAWEGMIDAALAEEG